MRDVKSCTPPPTGGRRSSLCTNEGKIMLYSTFSHNLMRVFTLWEVSVDRCPPPSQLRMTMVGLGKWCEKIRLHPPSPLGVEATVCSGNHFRLGIDPGRLEAPEAH